MNINWKEIGQWQAMMVSFMTTIMNICRKVGVGVEIIEYLATGPGKIAFEKFLLEHGEECKKTQRVRVIDALTIEVNLDAALILPFNGAEVANKPKGTGWVRVERKGDDLFVGGKRLDLYLSDKQKTGTIVGHELRKELEGKDVLHPNILDALKEHSHLIPEKFKKNENSTVYLFFWDVIFRSPEGGSLCVRCLCFSDGNWQADCHWLDYDFFDNYPAAVRAS